MLKTLQRLTAPNARFEWDVIYQEKGRIHSAFIRGNEASVLQQRLDAFITAERQLLVVLALSKGFLKRKYAGSIVEHRPIRSLSWRHNLNVFLRNSYNNGEELCKELERLLQEGDREERLRTFSIKERPEELWFVLKAIKEAVTTTPVLLTFSSAERSWEEQREFYVEPLVEYEQQLHCLEIVYHPDSPSKTALQDIFIRFNVRRVPTWIMATPVKRGGKSSVQITRFDRFRDAYFARQESEGRPPMRADKQEDVAEAFTGFILWGLGQTAAVKANESISL